EIAGHPMVWYVLKALREIAAIERIVVVGPVQQLSEHSREMGCEIVEGGKSMVESLENGLTAIGNSSAVLVTTCDIPLITAQALEDFLKRCDEREAELYYSVVSRDDNDKAYPEVQRTYVRLRDGVFTGGNVVLVKRPEMVGELKTILNQAVAFRKQPVKMCRLLGLSFLVKLIAGKLTIAEIENRVRKMLHLDGACIISPYPEIGIDVDKPSDLELAKKVLNSN
ncbi:MAG TPA: 4-diphosphocytidyl-2C-methyl-D-erythritol kinase, partial [Firmicutes bacterium]|nr:4-diphosphocytidyl-2C-methyl-D-erythritol kinase [Bacillota bacterium]